MNQFVSDDMTQFEYDATLHKFMCQCVMPKYRVSDGKTQEQTVESIWANCIRSTSKSRREFRRVVTHGSKTEEVEAELVSRVAKPTRSPTSVPTHATTAPASTNMAAAIKELGSAIGGSLAALPKKVTISLTFEL